MTDSERPISVLAIIAAYNEADVIGCVIDDLVRQGVAVHLLDDDSTDGTGDVARQYLGRGVVAVERARSADRHPDGYFHWREILRRKEAVALGSDADWFIHHDADEFRQSPWPGVRLVEAIAWADCLGFNAIDFERLDFLSVEDDPNGSRDVRDAIRDYRRPADYDRVQIRCWKRTGARVDLASTGGHQAQFPGRRVFPIPFLLRHYPIRGAEHGRRKVFTERLARFLPEERADGWHIQYDRHAEETSLLVDRSSMTRFDLNRYLLSSLVSPVVRNEDGRLLAEGAGGEDSTDSPRRRQLAPHERDDAIQRAIDFSRQLTPSQDVASKAARSVQELEARIKVLELALRQAQESGHDVRPSAQSWLSASAWWPRLRRLFRGVAR